MSRIAYLLALWGVFVMGAGFAAQGATRAERDAKNSSERTGPTASSIQSDNPSPHFFAARDAFNKRDNDACARELRLAGDIMKRDASEAKMWTAHKLRDAGSDLDTLAERVQRGQVNSVDDINQRVEQSYNALSDFHYQLARESYERNRKSGVTTGRDPETGQYLNAAANDLESWARYSGRAVEAGTRTAIDDTKSLAGKMISGAGYATERTGEALNNFGEAIKSFGRRVGDRIRGNAGPGALPPPTMPRNDTGTQPQ